MAEKDKGPRAERLDRRNRLKEEKKRELQITLEAQGVELEDDDLDSIILDEDEKIEGDGNASVAGSQVADDNVSVAGSHESQSLGATESETKGEDESSDRQHSSQIKERTERRVTGRKKIAERLSEVERREHLAQLREDNLESRRQEFESELKAIE